MPDDKDGIIAASPMVQGSCESPHRIVIRDLGDQYVVHTQVVDGTQKPWFHQGDYFVKTNDSAPIAHPPGAEGLRKAWARFEERVRRSLQMPRPDQRAKEIADIAESIINALLPENEHDRDDMFADDYQLDSDLETFEHFTGKAIRPAKEEIA
jgi:hypothetical protein